MINFLLFFTIFILPFYLLFIIGAIRFLRILGVSRNIAVFAGFAMFGIGVGFVSSVWDAGSEQWHMFNYFPAVIAETISHEALRQFGNLNSFFVSSTVPWILREPQIGFLASTIVWSFMGIIAQWLVDLRPRPDTRAKAEDKGRPINSKLVVGFLIGLVLVFTGTLYIKSGEHLGPQPYAVGTLPSAFPVYGQVADSPKIETWQVYDVMFEDSTITTDRMHKVIFFIEHTGDTGGLVLFEIKIDGVVRAFNQGYINPGQKGPVSFMLVFPFSGEYTISLKNLSQKIQVV